MNNHYVFYFDNSASNWNVKTWVWDDADNSRNYTGGTWPGADMPKDAASGYHKYEFDCTNANPNLKVIFSNNGDNKTQTANLELVHNGIYNAQGFTGKVYDSKVESVGTVEGMRVYVSAGVLYVEAPAACSVAAVRVDGSMITLSCVEGVNRFSLPRGFYIVGGHKVIL